MTAYSVKSALAAASLRSGSKARNTRLAAAGNVMRRCWRLTLTAAAWGCFLVVLASGLSAIQSYYGQVALLWFSSLMYRPLIVVALLICGSVAAGIVCVGARPKRLIYLSLPALIFNATTAVAVALLAMS